MNNLGGWSISKQLFNWIRNNIKDNSIILELGSGYGTIELTKYYKVYSIEQNKKFLNLAEKSNYIYSPIKNYGDYYWYDIDYLTNVPDKYDVLLIDGPTSDGSIPYIREGILHHLDIIKSNIIIIDDTNRDYEKKLALKISEILGYNITDFKGNNKDFMVLKKIK